MEAFPLRLDFQNLFFTFLQGSLNPQNFELNPQILKIITSALQLPEAILPRSQKTLGASIIST